MRTEGFKRHAVTGVNLGLAGNSSAGSRSVETTLSPIRTLLGRATCLLLCIVAQVGFASDQQIQTYPPLPIRIDLASHRLNPETLHLRTLHRDEQGALYAYPHIRIGDRRHYFVHRQEGIYEPLPAGWELAQIRKSPDTLKFRVLVPHHQINEGFISRYPDVRAGPAGSEGKAWDLTCLTIGAMAPRLPGDPSANGQPEPIGLVPGDCGPFDARRHLRREGSYWYRDHDGDLPHEGLVLVLQTAEDFLAEPPEPAGAPLDPASSAIPEILSGWSLRLLDHEIQPGSCRFVDPPPGAEIASGKGYYLIDAADLPLDGECLLGLPEDVEVIAGGGPVPRLDGTYFIPGDIDIALIRETDPPLLKKITSGRLQGWVAAGLLDSASPDAVLVMNWSREEPAPLDGVPNVEEVTTHRFALIRLPEGYRPVRIEFLPREGEEHDITFPALEAAPGKSDLIGDGRRRGNLFQPRGAGRVARRSS